MTDQTPPAEEPTPEEQRESLTEAQNVGETTSPQAEQQQERDAAEPSGEAPDQPAISQDEQNARAAHQSEGGGAWPPELLAEKGVVPGQPIDANALHEQQASEAEQS